jgi:hypothetical protein
LRPIGGISRRHGGKTAVMAVKPPFLTFAVILIEISVLYSITSYIVFPFLKHSFHTFFTFTFFLDFGHAIIFGFTVRQK